MTLRSALRSVQEFSIRIVWRNLWWRRLRRKPSQKVFCIGSPKTGTTSLGRALKILGSKHKGWDEKLWDFYVKGDYHAIFDEVQHWDSFDDGPWNGPDLHARVGPPFYKLLDSQYPGSKFILTVRDIESWSRSHESHFSAERGTDINEKYQISNYALHRARIVEEYLARNEAVQKYFSDRPENFLIMRVCDGEGWECLCSFLGMPAPSISFPRANISKNST